MARGATRERGATRAHTSGDGAPALHEVVARRREDHGGLQWGAAFFGWLVAIGLASLLSAEASSDAGTIGIVGGIVMLAIHRKFDKTGAIA